MNSYQGFDASSYLEHYGVLGMKWGIRKNPQKAFSKSMKKLGALDRSASKSRYASDYYKSKSDKKAYKSDITISNFMSKKLAKESRKLRARSSNYNLRAARAESRARKWVSSMNKQFQGIKINDISDSDISLGKKYALGLVNRK